MPDKANNFKELKSLLEDSQKDLLKALNNNSSFLARLFSGSSKDTLRKAQSFLSKAINQLESFKNDDQAAMTKLQQRISERDSSISDLEAKLDEKTKELSENKDKIRQLEAKLDSQSQIQVPQQQEIKDKINPEQVLIENLEQSIRKLEEKNSFLNEKLTQTLEEKKDANKLVIEFSNRVKKLKSELTCK